MTPCRTAGISPNKPNSGVTGHEVGPGILVTSTDEDLFADEPRQGPRDYEPTENECEEDDKTLEDTFMEAAEITVQNGEDSKFVEDDAKEFECTPCGEIGRAHV